MLSVLKRKGALNYLARSQPAKPTSSGSRVAEQQNGRVAGGCSRVGTCHAPNSSTKLPSCKENLQRFLSPPKNRLTNVQIRKHGPTARAIHKISNPLPTAYLNVPPHHSVPGFFPSTPTPSPHISHHRFPSNLPSRLIASSIQTTKFILITSFHHHNGPH